MLGTVANGSLANDVTVVATKCQLHMPKSNDSKQGLSNFAFNFCKIFEGASVSMFGFDCFLKCDQFVFYGGFKLFF